MTTLLAALLCSCWPACLLAQVDAAAAERPNIILILADDLGYGELGSYGQTKIKTPHLDRLAASGRRFLRAYAGSPVCAPSRCVLMTGKASPRAYIRDNKEIRPEGQAPLPASVPTIGNLLSTAGYRTGAIGKWGLGPVDSTGDPNAKGFALFFGYNCQREAHNFYPRWLWLNDQKFWLDNHPFRAHQKKPGMVPRMDDYRGGQYAPDLMLAQARAFLRVEDERPFFLYLPFLEPHLAMQPPAEWVERYPEAWDSAPYFGERGYLPHPRPRAGYAAMISDLDEHVGAVLTVLQEQGFAENTLVLFTSDNGATHDVGGADTEFFASTGGLRGRKGSVYEGGLRVPLIARWPGRVPPKSACSDLVGFEDFLPTLMAVAGEADPFEGKEGRNFLPLLEGRQMDPRAPLLQEFHGYGGQLAVIGERWKFLRRGLKRKLQDPELYDLVADPNEQVNVAEQHPELVQRFELMIREARTPSTTFPLPYLDR